MENTNDALQEQLQGLATGNIDEQARLVLMEQAAGSATLTDEIVFSQSLVLALRNPDAVAAHAKIKAVIAAEGFPPPPPTANSLSKSILKWAGITALVILLSVGFLMLSEQIFPVPSTTQQLSRTIAEPLDNVFFLPDGADQLPDLRSAMESYDSRQYGKAAKKLAEYVKNRPESGVFLYLGISRLLSGRGAEAIEPLRFASGSAEPPIRESALWYLALAYLEQNDPQSARQVLSQLAESEIYGKQAEALLQQF